MRAPDDILEIFLGPGEFYFGEAERRKARSTAAMPTR